MRALRHAFWSGVVGMGALLAFLVTVRVGWVLGAFVVFAAGWVRHTAESAAAAEDVVGALGECGISHKAAAHYMDISQAQLSAQLAGEELLALWRLASLPVSFQIAYARRRLARFGLAVISQPVLQELLATVQDMAEDYRSAKKGRAA